MSIPMTANMQTLRSSLNYNFGDFVQEPENTHSFIILESITHLVEAMDYSRDITARYWSMLDGIKDFERVEMEELFARREAIYQAHVGGLIEDWLYSSLVGRNEANYEIGHKYMTEITKPHIERKAQLQTKIGRAHV